MNFLQCTTTQTHIQRCCAQQRGVPRQNKPQTSVTLIVTLHMYKHTHTLPNIDQLGISLLPTRNKGNGEWVGLVHSVEKCHACSKVKGQRSASLP